MAPAGTELVPVTGRFAPRYISSRAAAAIAGHATLDALAAHVSGWHAVLLACFGDPGLAALKELSPVPVVGMAEASCHLACTLDRRFSIVTSGERWPAMLEEFVAAQGLGSRLASVRAISLTGDRIAADIEGSLGLLAAACAEAATEDGAEVVILGGAALAGLAAAVQVPVLCSLAAGVAAIVALATLPPAKAGQGGYAATPAVETVGLAAELAGRLARGEAPSSAQQSCVESTLRSGRIEITFGRWRLSVPASARSQRSFESESAVARPHCPADERPLLPWSAR